MMDSEWSDAWAVVSDPITFANRFNAAVPGSHRLVTPDDVRELAYCGLIGRHGFFDRSDLQTVRGILQYEKVRETRIRKVDGDIYKQMMLGESDDATETERANAGVKCR